jgi:hypothetical protein
LWWINVLIFERRRCVLRLRLRRRVRHTMTSSKGRRIVTLQCATLDWGRALQCDRWRAAVPLARRRRERRWRTTRDERGGARARRQFGMEEAIRRADGRASDMWLDRPCNATCARGRIGEWGGAGIVNGAAYNFESHGVSTSTHAPIAVVSVAARIDEHALAVAHVFN